MTSERGSAKTWVVTLATALGVVTTASLGAWQLRRADQKATLQAQQDQRQHLPVLTDVELLSACGNAELTDCLHRRARLSGHWLPHATVFLDNRPMAQRAGFYVVTPLQLEADGRVLLIQRGWVPRDFQDRTRLPPVSTPSGRVTVFGRIAPAPSKVYAFAGNETGPLRQNVDTTDMAQTLGMPVANASLVQLEDDGQVVADGLLRDWPVVGSGVHKHLGYAAQWFGLSALIAGLYVWFQLYVPRRRRPSSLHA